MSDSTEKFVVGVDELPGGEERGACLDHGVKHDHRGEGKGQGFKDREHEGEEVLAGQAAQDTKDKKELGGVTDTRSLDADDPDPRERSGKSFISETEFRRLLDFWRELSKEGSSSFPILFTPRAILTPPPTHLNSSSPSTPCETVLKEGGFSSLSTGRNSFTLASEDSTSPSWDAKDIEGVLDLIENGDKDLIVKLLMIIELSLESKKRSG